MNAYNHTAYDSFVTDLIRKYSELDKDGYYLHTSQIPFSEKIIFLSHILDAYDYEDALKNMVRTKEYMNEYKKEMQVKIDSLIDDVYRIHMNDKGFVTRRCSNGDIVWERG